MGYAQPKLFTGEWDNESGTGGTKNYTVGYPFELAGAGGFYRIITSVPSNTNAFFRFRNNANTTDRQPSVNGTAIPLATNYTSSITDGNSNAFQVSSAVVSRRYVFKVNAAITSIAIFEIQGTNVRTISSVARDLTNVYPGQGVVVTSTLSGAFDAGQAVFLRYSNDNFTTSSVVKMTGSGTTYAGTIPSATNGATLTVRYYAFTSGDVASITPAEADLYTFNLNNNGGSNYSYTVASSWATTTLGNWSNPNTWVASVVPVSGHPVVINHNVTLDQNATVSGLIVSSTGIFNGSSNTLSISSGGTFVVNVSGTFNANTSTISCLGTATLAPTSYNNITTAGILNLSSTTTINGTLQINDAGTVAGSAPTYGNSSTLTYNRTTGSSYTLTGTTVEWTGNGTTAGVGIPQNLTLTNASGSGNFNLTLPTGNRGIAGNVTIGANTTFICGANDFYIAGNFTNDGTFTDNNRAIFFNGGNIQTISGTNNPAFAYMIISKTANNVVLNRDITIEGSGGGGNAFEINNTGSLDLNDKTFTYTSNNSNDINITGGTRTISNTGSGTGTFEILSTGNASPNQTDLVVATGGVLNIGTKVKLSLRGTGSNSGFSVLNLPANALTFTGDFEINTRGGLTGSNAPVYNTGSILRYNSGGNYDRNLEWNAATGAGYPHHVVLANSTIFSLGANGGTTIARQLAGDLTVGSVSRFDMNTTNIMTQALTIKGIFTNNGTFDLSTDGGGKLLVEGNVIQNGTFTANSNDIRLLGTANQDLQIDASTTFAGLSIRKSAGTVTLKGTQASLNVTGVLELNDASNATDLNLNGKNILLAGTGSLLEDLTGNDIVKDLTATTESNKGGYIEFTRTVTTTLTDLANSGLSLFRTGGSDYSVTVRRSHYTPSGNVIGTGNKGIKKIYNIVGTPTGTTGLYIKYATEELGTVGTPNMMYKWNTGPGWKKADDASIGMTVSVAGNEVRATGSIVSFSDWTVGDNASPLPITLLTFAGKKLEDTQASLTWRTASEINNKGFYIEKSTDAVDFKTIGYLDGAGNSTSIREYNFIDNNLIASAYYRLRQIDFDGTTTYSPIILIENEIFKIFPNPITQNININLPILDTETVQIRLTNATGQDVSNISVLAGKASNALSQAFADLPAGIYIARIQSVKKTWIEKIIKQ